MRFTFIEAKKVEGFLVLTRAVDGCFKHAVSSSVICRRWGVTVALCSQLLSFGCGEYIHNADFRLAIDSRIPSWFGHPECRWAGECAVFLATFDSHLRVRLYGPDGRRIGEVRPTREGDAEATELEGPKTGDAFEGRYPGYVVVSFQGVREIFEFRLEQGTFHVVDDPALIERVMQVVKSKAGATKKAPSP